MKGERTTVSASVRIAIGLAVLGAIGFAYFVLGDRLSLEQLASNEAALRQFQAEHPSLVYGIAFAIYVSVTGLSLPGAAGLTLVFGWYFGFWRAVLLVSFASTAGAVIAFTISRFLLRDSLQSRFGTRLATFNEALEREGAYYLFTLRLIPAVPFFVINVVMGLTPIATVTYWWVSQLGMLPGTAVYVYAGASVPDLATLAENGASGILSLNVLFAFAILGVFPFFVKKAMQRLRSTNVPDDENRNVHR